MDKKILDILEKMDEFGKKNFMFNVPRETGELLNLLVMIKKPKKILEIGMSNGYSTIWLAEPGFPVVSIEADPKKIILAKENFKKARLKNIKILEGFALGVLKNLNKKFDFVFIDGIKKEYLGYFKLLKLNKNAVVVADNIISHDIRDYHNFVNKKYKSYLVRIGSGIEITLIE